MASSSEMGSAVRTAPITSKSAIGFLSDVHADVGGRQGRCHPFFAHIHVEALAPAEPHEGKAGLGSKVRRQARRGTDSGQYRDAGESSLLHELERGSA